MASTIFSKASKPPLPVKAASILSGFNLLSRLHLFARALRGRPGNTLAMSSKFVPNTPIACTIWRLSRVVRLTSSSWQLSHQVIICITVFSWRGQARGLQILDCATNSTVNLIFVTFLRCWIDWGRKLSMLVICAEIGDFTCEILVSPSLFEIQILEFWCTKLMFVMWKDNFVYIRISHAAKDAFISMSTFDAHLIRVRVLEKGCKCSHWKRLQCPQQTNARYSSCWCKRHYWRRCCIL